MVLAAALCLALRVPAFAQIPTHEERIRTLRAESNAAIARQDVAGILESMEENIHVSAGAGAFLDGREAIGEAFRSRFVETPDAVYVRTTEAIDVGHDGVKAAESGRWLGTWTAPDGPVRIGGRYMAYWRRTGDRWLIHSELFVQLSCEGAGCEPEPAEGS